MKNITKDCSYPEKTVDPPVDPLHRMFLALVVTGIVYFTAGSRLPDRTIAVSDSPQSTVNLSQSVASAVLPQASQQSWLPASALHIVRAHTHTWDDSCRALCEPACTRSLEPGWQVTVSLTHPAPLNLEF